MKSLILSLVFVFASLSAIAATPITSSAGVSTAICKAVIHEIVKDQGISAADIKYCVENSEFVRSQAEGSSSATQTMKYIGRPAVNQPEQFCKAQIEFDGASNPSSVKVFGCSNFERQNLPFIAADSDGSCQWTPGPDGTSECNPQDLCCRCGVYQCCGGAHCK
jgi:hypothetical protein